MKFTFNWLKEFVDVNASPGEIAERLTMAGLEVESLAPLPSGNEEGDDWLVEVAVTPNRSDCLGILGLAREVAALTGGSLSHPPATAHARGGKELVEVKILSPRLCRRYSARIVERIRVSSSPPWMRFRLEACGIRAINNVVDVTNYVMLETGQPLHAFDLDRLISGKILVRQAAEDKRFVTLDGIERELASDNLLICDDTTPIALAGVMGGRDSQVSPETSRVLIESANFDPLTVRRTARRLGIHSEASYRFERGVDPEGTLEALDRAAFLLGEVAGGAPQKGVVDVYPGRRKAAPLFIRGQRAKELLGIELKRKEMEKIFISLGLKILGRSKAGLKVLAPSYRHDLTREADLVEELARFYRYDRIPSTFPLIRPQGGMDSRLRQERKVRAFLVGEGLSEMINLPFISQGMNQRFSGTWEDGRNPVSLLNALVSENDQMRLSLIPGLLENLRVHVARKIRSFAAFDLGKVFSLDAKGAPEEKQHVAGLLFGQRERRGLRGTEPPLTFLDIKGLVEGILEMLKLDDRVAWTACGTAPFLHPAKAAVVQLNGDRIGYFGEIHPDVCEQIDLPPSLVFELDFERMLQYPSHELTVRPLPRFPSVERDLAVVVDAGFPAQRVIHWIKALGHPLIEEVQVFDQYRGASIPGGKKSLAYTISYRSDDRTLTDDEVNDIHENITSRLVRDFDAELRK